jgi:hypothetical protein
MNSRRELAGIHERLCSTAVRHWSGEIGRHCPTNVSTQIPRQRARHDVT